MQVLQGVRSAELQVERRQRRPSSRVVGLEDQDPLQLAHGQLLLAQGEQRLDAAVTQGNLAARSGRAGRLGGQPEGADLCGQVVGDLEQAQERVEGLAVAGVDLDGLFEAATGQGRLLESVEFWTNFRIAPSVETLRARYAIEPLGESGRALYGGIWCEARLLLEACLEALLPHRLLDRTGRPCPEGLSRTSGWGSWRQRIREWRWLGGYETDDRLHIWRRGFGVAFRLSPVEITYLIETIEQGAPVTPFLDFGDTVRIEMTGEAGDPLFGAIDQRLDRSG